MKNRLFFLLFFCVPLSAQSVDSLTESLTKNVLNDSMKVLSIYDWVTKNVVYDHRFVRSRVEGDTNLLQEPYNVVIRKKAICIGFAKLVKTMCLQAGIQAIVVDGYTKSVNNEIDREEHAWNAVKFNGEWHLLDPTWDASTYSNFQKYRMPTPSLFSENHYPHDPIWQLSDNPKNFECFKQPKFCTSISKTAFNYRDTISALEKKDTLARLMDVGQRTLRFFPADLEAIRNMANAQSGYALEAYNAYYKIREDAVARRNVVLNQSEILQILDKVEFHLTEARQYYERLTTFARVGSFTDAHINRDMMMENLMKLEKERKFAEKIFKK
jgi:hypothetical protein